MKILFNYRDGTQRCNSRLDIFESQQRASTFRGSNILYHLRIYRRTQATTSGDYGQDGAAGAWAPPPNQQGLQDLFGTTGWDAAADSTAHSAGAAVLYRDYRQDGAADGLSRSTQQQVDDSTTQTYGERADASVRKHGTWSQLYTKHPI